MGKNPLPALRDVLHHALDDYDGDADTLGRDTSMPATGYDVNPSTGSAMPRVSMFKVHSVGKIDASVTRHGIQALPAP